MQLEVLMGGQQLTAEVRFVDGQLLAAPLGSPPYEVAPFVWAPAVLADGELTVKSPYGR
jgi:hypothetical protein